MRFEERYATAIRTSSLKSEAKTTLSSADILGAAGFAQLDSDAANRMKNELAFAMLRLLLGDNASGDRVIEILSDRAIGKAYRLGPEIDRTAASFVARLVLDWYRDPTCKACGGHGFKRMQNAPALSDQACLQCRGAGKRDFDALFPLTRLPLARWLAVELERETALAGPAAMVALAPRLDFP